MLRLQDFILLAVIFSSIGAAILFPALGTPFRAFPLYCMMALLFLSFLSIPARHIWEFVTESPGFICLALIFKLLALPVAVFFLFHWLLPGYALAALLLTGISTGVVSPFFAELVLANAPLVVVTVVTSSLFVPVTLPALVRVLAGSNLEIPFSAMAQILALVVFIPFALSELVKLLSERWTQKILKKRFLISLAMFAVTNLGIFSKYSSYFRQQPSDVLTALAVACVLAAIFFAFGVVFSWKMPIREQLAVIIDFVLVNNVLVLVFSAHFFTPREPFVAAMYMVPFYFLLIPLRAYQAWRLRASEQ